MPRPLVTIISPTFNQERYVAACAESALGQTYQDWEQIFVDDGSSDRTREILAGYSDPRIRVIAQPHAGLRGLGGTYNAALAESRGSLVAILEGDDQWPADKLEVQVPSFDSPRTILSWGRAELVDDHGVTVGEVATMSGRHHPRRLQCADAFHRLTRRNFLVPTVTVMVRRQALDAIGGFHQTGSSMLVDLPTWLWVTATVAGELAFLNHRLGLYRVHTSQTSQQRRSEMTREHFAIVRAVEEQLDATTLERVGWSERSRRRAETRALLAEGELGLEAGRHAEARAAFSRAFRGAVGAADRALAVGGVMSSLLHLDLVRRAFAVRAWLHRVRSQPAAGSTRD